MGWKVVYFLVIFINSMILNSEGIGIKDPRNWMSLCCLMLAYFAGLYGN